MNHLKPTRREGLENNGKLKYAIKYNKGKYTLRQLKQPQSTEKMLLEKKTYQKPKVNLLVLRSPPQKRFLKRKIPKKRPPL